MIIRHSLYVKLEVHNWCNNPVNTMFLTLEWLWAQYISNNPGFLKMWDFSSGISVAWGFATFARGEWDVLRRLCDVYEETDWVTQTKVFIWISYFTALDQCSRAMTSEDQRQCKILLKAVQVDHNLIFPPWRAQKSLLHRNGTFCLRVMVIAVPQVTHIPMTLSLILMTQGYLICLGLEATRGEGQSCGVGHVVALYLWWTARSR